MNGNDKSEFYDYSTLDLVRLRHLPIHKKPPTYNYQDGPGNGCMGDPPGFPTYFTRNVYTQFGNNPGRGAVVVITVPGEKPRVVETTGWRPGDDWDKHHARQQAKIRRLWKPLSLNHPRTKAWIRDLHRHLHSCYVDDSKKERDNDRTVIWPVPDYKLKSFTDDPRFSDKWREKEKESVRQANKETRAYYRKIATPDNHSAVRTIRKFYADYQPEQDLIDNPPTAVEPQWWERYGQQPTPGQCAGLGGPHRHPIGDPCQTCGHSAKKGEEDGLNLSLTGRPKK